MKAATRQICVIACDLGISIHAAREGGDYGKGDKNMTKFISIHAAREGGDLLASAVASATSTFQSTPPVKAATDVTDCERLTADISIHAAREGGDSPFAKAW